jgi:uncharacterized protein YfdQ (DUF2303 family)
MNDAEAIADLGRRAAGATVVDSHDAREFLIVPREYEVREITDAHGLFKAKPAYIKQSVTLQTKDSLVDYTNRFRGDDTILFADISANSISALIDYHKAVGIDAPVGAANFGAHRATMALAYSEEWRIWTGISGHLKPQLEFARFIEENAADITAPSGAELLEAVRDLQARRKVNFTKAVRTASDNEDFEYTDETETRSNKGNLELPTKFQLGLPVYFGEPPTELYGFLRWKLDEGALMLGVQLHRAEHVRQAVFRQIVLDVAGRTSCPVVFGKPS